MLPDKIVFVDIETTGLRAFYDRIIEIAVLRVENNKISKSFHTLLNPQAHLPPEITMITGITARELEYAPTFRQIKNDLLEIMDGCVFVAHNVRFDYSFLKNEFQRLEHTFKSKHFCTVRLSRALYPQFRHHNLDSIIERFRFDCANRHRAFDDAKILFTFYEKILQDFSIDQISRAIDIGLKKPNIPLKLKTDLKNIPEKPGVYIFYAENGAPLYIGKSINLRNRILSHFSADIHSPLEMKISQQIETIETIITAGELGALFLESKLIKKMLPLYNKKARIKRELAVLKKVTNKNGYDEVVVQIFHNNSNNLDNILGFFKSKKQAKNFLAETAKEFSLCEKLLGLESSSWRTNGPCFAHRLGRCKGACIDKENPLAYNLRFTSAFASTKIKSWPFSGPILIEESDGYQKEYFVINNWCYLGSYKLNIDGAKDEKLSQTVEFDLDIYKILKQYLSKPGNYKNIRQIKPENLISLNSPEIL